MSGGKHTPGPWRVESHYKQGQTVVADKSLEVALCWRHSAHLPEEQTWANAHLIAAAPDLLEALEELVVTADSMRAWIERQSAATPEDHAAIARARAAIAKAKGEAR